MLASLRKHKQDYHQESLHFQEKKKIRKNDTVYRIFTSI